MIVELVEEHADGSATYTISDITKEEHDGLMRFAIMEALKNAIKEGEKYKVDSLESKDESNDGLENT
jgi:anti-sigma28 factor (negative regulator of flagellin synthesis)